jgi:hypothetical protein
MTAAVLADDFALQPSATQVRERFRTSAQALMVNRPLREVGPRATLSEGELTALQAVGLSTEPWPGAAEQDPLARTIVDYMALIETSLTAGQAAKLLGVDVSRIRQRLRAGTLMGIEYEGEWRLPLFQFERGLVLPGLGEVIAALPAGMNPLDVVLWFLEPNVDLEPAISPRAWLLAGHPAAAVAGLAQHL